MMRPLFPWFLPFLLLLSLLGAPLSEAEDSSQRTLWEDLPPHPDHPIEWWYMTGFLTSETDRHFGFQATFFRMTTTLSSSASLSSDKTSWAPKELFGFHGAVSDLDRKRFFSTERERRGFSRSVIAQQSPFSVRIGRNRLDHPNPDQNTLSLVFRVGSQSFNLTLFPQSPPIWHDIDKKFFTGPNATDWAYYYSYPLVTIRGTRTTVLPDGTIRTDAVHGHCWFDHEWMLHTMNKKQIGWIWVWGWNKTHTQGIMLYQMLDQGAKLSPFHRATILSKNGKEWTVRRTDHVTLISGLQSSCLTLQKIKFLVEDEPHSQVIAVHPLIKKQVLSGAVNYWEGASTVMIGETAHKEGVGYLEVTGLEKWEHGKICLKRTIPHS